MKVGECMSENLVFVPDTADAAAALAVAHRRGVHYLLVVDGDNDLKAVTCLCQIARASASDVVGSFARSPVTFVEPDTTLEQAARIMADCSVGCLPVIREPGRVVGVITRHDLREHIVLSKEDSEARCAACGTTHDIRESIPGAPFCRSCLESTPEPGTIARRWYCTLGGGD
jgi:CBS domain-containing protein